MERRNVLKYASLSANLYNFLGDKNFVKHIDVYKSVIDNALQAHEDCMQCAVERVKVIDPHNVTAVTDNSPLPLFVTFHTGSYNMLTAYWLMRGYPVNVLSDTESVANNDYQSITRIYRDHFKNECWLDMVNVEENGAIFNILRGLRSGKRATVAYLDGNKGIGGQTKVNENMVKLKFLKGYVFVRKGLAFLAYLTKQPIVVAIAHREGNENVLTFHKPIVITEKDREKYCEQAMTSIFDVFQGHVKNYYDQWSNWLYVHLWSDLEYFREKMSEVEKQPHDHSPKGELAFNADRFCPLKFEGRACLFDRGTYTMLQTDEAVQPIFSYKTTEDVKRTIISDLLRSDPQKVDELIDKNILIEA